MFYENQEQDFERRHRLNETIDEMYGELASDEVEILASAFERSLVTMVEVADVHRNKVVLKDFCEETEFEPTIVSPLLLDDLRSGDVFMAHLGWREGRWEIIWLSPAYEPMGTDGDQLPGDHGGGWPC